MLLIFSFNVSNGFGRYADLKNNRLTNYTFNFDQMLNDKVHLPFMVFVVQIMLSN